MAAMQSLMPGQAQGFQFAPPQAKGTPSAVVQQYSGMPLDELVQEYMRNPSIQLLARIDEVRKQDQARAAVQGQLAQQQAQQQQGTVANETLMQAAQAAQPQQMPGMQGMPVRRMATGGIVALAGGGSSFVPGELLVNPDYDKNGNPRSSTERDTIIRQNAERIRAARAAQEGKDKNFFERLGPDEPLRRIYDYFSTPSERRVPIADALTNFFTQPTPSAAAAPAVPAATAPAAPYPEPLAVREARRVAGVGTGSAAGSTQRRRIDESTEKPPAAAPAATPAVDPRMQAFQALMAASQPQGVSPELQAQRERVSGIQALQEQLAMEDARRIREEVVRTGQRRMDRANLPLLEDTQALAALMGSIDPTKGKLFGSLGTGLASVLGAREARKEKAEEYVSAGSEKVRQLNNTYRQLQLETAKYQEARLANDAKTARESAEKIAALRYKFETESAELEIKRSEARAKTIAAGAQAAAVPGRQALAEASLLQKRMQSPEGVQYSQLADAKAKLLANPLADAKAVAALDAEMARLQRLMDVKYGSIGTVASTAATPATGTTDVEARAAEIMKGQ
jgi:hypothetical protein